MSNQKGTFELVVSVIQVLSVVVGVVLSVLSFNDARDKESEAHLAEARAREIEANRPFVELRRNVYLEAVKTAAIIATPEGRTRDELIKARRRFQELYVAELTMVEDSNVEEKMVTLAQAVDPDIANLTPAQLAALRLAQALKYGYQKQSVN